MACSTCGRAFADACGRGNHCAWNYATDRAWDIPNTTYNPDPLPKKAADEGPEPLPSLTLVLLKSMMDAMDGPPNPELERNGQILIVVNEPAAE